MSKHCLTYIKLTRKGEVIAEHLSARHLILQHALGQCMFVCLYVCIPYSVFFSSVLKFILLPNIFPHDQRACVGVWCMCARKRRKLNQRKSIFFCAERKFNGTKKTRYTVFVRHAFVRMRGWRARRRGMKAEAGGWMLAEPRLLSLARG